MKVAKRASSPLDSSASSEDMEFAKFSPVSMEGFLVRGDSSQHSSSSSPIRVSAVLKIHAFYLIVFVIYLLVTQPSQIGSTLDSLDGTTSSLSSSNRQLHLRQPHFSGHLVREKRALFEPECAKGLVVDLLDQADNPICSGLLLRDDLVLADRSCLLNAWTAIVLQPDAPLLLHHNDVDASLSRQSRAIIEVEQLDPSAALATIEIPKVHFQSGWPRKRAFLLHDHDEERFQGQFISDTSTRILRLEQGRSIHLACFGELPVISFSSEDNVNKNVASPKIKQDVLRFPQDRRVAAMSNLLGEKWWVPRRSKSHLIKQLFSRKRVYTSVDQNTTLDIIRGGGDEYHQYLLEAEDPKVRNAASVWKLYIQWQTQHTFSGEPFFQWLDFGSGRSATYDEYSRSEIEDEYCAVMDEARRAKAAVVPQVVHDDDDDATTSVILKYEVAGLPVEGGDMLFVWGLDSKMYVAPNEGVNFHHMCFFGGRPVRMAGEIVVGSHGRLKEVWPDSGHYKPTDWHYRLFYRHLKHILPDMKNDAIKWVNHRTDKKPKEWVEYLFAP